MAEQLPAEIVVDWDQYEIRVDGQKVPGVILEDLDIISGPHEIPGVRFTLAAERVTIAGRGMGPVGAGPIHVGLTTDPDLAVPGTVPVAKVDVYVKEEG